MANYITNCPYVYFTDNRDPTATESDVTSQGLPSDWISFWKNTVSQDIFVCRNLAASSGSLQWDKLGTSANMSSMMTAALSSMGWNINASRNYSSPSLSFNSSRTPSATNDVLVIANISQSNTLLTSTTVNAQINTGSGMTTRATTQMSGVLAATITPLTFLVPKGASYQLSASGTGTNTLTSIHEILL